MAYETFNVASTRTGRFVQLFSPRFWGWILKELVREILFGPKPQRVGQWVYHPHRGTWEFRELPKTWYPRIDHP